MKVSELKNLILNKDIPNFLIFTGEEWKVQEIYINKIADLLDTRYYADTFSEIFEKVTKPTFIKNRVLYIVRDDKDVMTNEKVQDQLDNGLMGDNVLIFLLSSVDKRTKFYKRYKDSLIEFERLETAVLRRYIKHECTLSDKNCDLLISICENDYGRILLEIDKIKRYAQAYPEEFDDVGFDTYYKRLVEDGTIYEPPYDAIFDLVDAILDRKVNRTFNLLEQSYAVGEATMVMLSVLYNNAKAVLQVQTYQGNNLSKATGLNGFSIKNAKKHVGKYKEKELIYILQLIQKIESGIKTGRMEDEFAMQYLLTHIM